MGSKTRQQLEDWIGVLDINADRVVDIGGSQLPITKRVESWNVKEYKILDLEQPHECKQKPDIIWDLNKPSRLSVNENSMIGEGFDIAFCLEVTEYWYDPMTAMKNIASMLKQGGKLYISFHFLYPVHNPLGKDLLRYTKDGAEKLLEEAGFRVDFTRTRIAKGKSMDSLREFYRLEGMRPTKLANCHHEIGALIEATKL